ncbi:T9SS type A sorting domain-containing protein [Chitinophagales bacterium]|nr:T9SS type A sorting domain-containing protein [Chitinophagales bacterium]
MKKLILFLSLFLGLSVAAQTTLLSEDFSGGALPAGWTNTGTGGAWTFSSTSPLNGVTLATTTVANGYAIFNSDVLGNDGLAENVDLITASFSCAGESVVLLSFEDVFAQFATSSGTVSVSANNGPWVDVYTVGPGIPQDNINGNPNVENIDISATAGNQANVRLRFKYQGDWDYWWVVDDILVYAPASNDAAIVDANISEYTAIPLSQVTPMTPSVEVLNNGGLPMTGITVTTTIIANSTNTTVYTATMTQASLAPGLTTTLTAANSFTPVANDLYLVENIVSINEADAVAANDTFVTAVSIEDSIYARDFFYLTGNAAFLDGPWFVGSGNNGQLGNVFRAEATADLVSVTAVFGGGFAIGDQTQANLYAMSGGAPSTLLASSAVLTVTAVDTPVVFYDFTFPANTSLTAGNDYFVSIQQNAASSDRFGLYSSLELFTPNTSFLQIGTGPWISIDTSGIGNQTFMVRANLYSPQTVTCAISDVSAGTQTVCNPANNTYTQQVIVTYANPPASGTLDVNGQSFAITSSPQTVTLTGLNADGQAVNVSAVFSADAACTYTENAVFTAPANCTPVCAITDLAPGNQTPCVNTTNLYTQEVIVTYSTAPTTGMLNVNGQMFAITGSPQTVTLTGLNSDGLSVDVIALFTANAACTYSENNVFTAPATCLCPTISVNVSSTSNSNCTTPNGTVTATASGGTAPYTYVWTPSGNGASLSGLPSGTYTVTVTDANGCAGSGTGSIGNTAGVNAVVGNVVDASCNSSADGTITINASGGTPPITYTWSDQGFPSALFSRSNLTAGSYTVVVEDAGGCFVNLGPITVDAPDALVVSLAGQTNVSCNGGNNGTIDMSVSGGTMPYSYTWSNSTSTSQDLSNLDAGTYQLTVTDANACPSVDGPQVSITEPAQIAVSLVSASDVTCTGPGSIDVSVTGGTPPYTYNWGGSNPSTEDLSSVEAGSYQLTVTDANSCSVTGSVIDIADAPTVTATATSTEESTAGAADGTATVSVNGGTAPYTYLWDDASAQMTATASGLSAGTYTVVVTDAQGCAATATVIVDLGSGIRELALADLRIYPNPTQKEVTISFTSVTAKDFEVAIYSTIGNVVLADQVLASSTYYRNFDVSALAAGVYFVEISNEEGKTLRKLTVLK